MTNSTLEVLCRLCLSNEGKMENIFCNDNDLQNKIYDCTSIEVNNATYIVLFIILNKIFRCSIF